MQRQAKMDGLSRSNCGNDIKYERTEQLKDSLNQQLSTCGQQPFWGLTTLSQVSPKIIRKHRYFHYDS